MNYKDNYRNDADAAWLRNLSYTVHPKPARFFMSAGSDYGACLACGKAEADKTGRFQIAAGFRIQFCARGLRFGPKRRVFCPCS